MILRRVGWKLSSSIPRIPPKKGPLSNVCWFIAPSDYRYRPSYVNQLTHLVLYPPNSPKVDCWSSHIQWKKPKYVMLKKKKQDPRKPARWKGRSKAVPRKSTSRQSHSWRQIQWMFLAFPPKVNENHHLDGVPHLDSLGSGQVQPMANPGRLFFWLLIMQQSAVHVADVIQIEFCQYQPNWWSRALSCPGPPDEWNHFAYPFADFSYSRPSVVYCKNRMVPIPNTSYIDPWFPQGQ